MSSTYTSLIFVTSLFIYTTGLIGCGGASTDAVNTSPQDDSFSTSNGDLVSEGSASSVEISGLLGTIPEDDVEKAVKGRWRHFEACYGEAIEVLEEIEGSVEMALEVDSEGQVTTAFLRDGNLGSSEAEICFVEQIKRLSFPKPAGGGKAVISYPMTLEAPYDHPKPLNWSGAKADKVVSENASDIQRCLNGQTGAQLTLYVVADGRVISAGGTADNIEQYEAALCIAEAAKSWKFPDPGKAVAKAVIKF